MVKNTSIVLGDGMIKEIETRREKRVSRSKYIREAVRLRFALEQAGLYEDVTADVESELEPADDAPLADD